MISYLILFVDAFDVVVLTSFKLLITFLDYYLSILFFFLRILNIFNTHGKRGESFLKKLTMVYIQKGLTFGYTVQALNLLNSHSFSNVGLTHCFLF